MTDWFYSILVIAATLSIAIFWWGRFSGIKGFFRDFWGILTTPLPVPFWALVLLGVGLSISFYRKRANYRKLLNPEE